MTIAALERMSDDEVRDTARALGLGGDKPRRDLIYDILEAQATATADARPERRRAARPRRPIATSWPVYMQDFDPVRVTLDGLIRKLGVLELLPDGYGFLRSAEYGYLPSADDIYVSPSQIKRFSLRLGDTVDGQVRPPKEGERFFALLRVHTINGRTPEDFTERTGFDFLTPGYPDAPLRLEPEEASALPTDAALTARLIDLVAPLGKGQRGLILAPPGAGRTLLVEHLARALRAGHPEATLIVLLVDERPEDAAAAARALPGVEVIATTFDDPPERQVHVADLVLEKAKRLVEAGQDVVVLVDSLTRLVRAHMAVARATEGTGRSAAPDSAAVRGPKRFFGAARTVEEGGSLTVLAALLTETGNAADEAIAGEFAGTGNLEIRLRADLAAAGLFPAVDVLASATRRVEMLLAPERLAAVRALRASLVGLGPGEALARLTERIRATASNDALLERAGN